MSAATNPTAINTAEKGTDRNPCLEEQRVGAYLNWAQSTCRMSPVR